jgi:hypothetical protein
MQSMALRLAVIAVLGLLLVAKFLLPSPSHQIASELMNANFAEALKKAGAEHIVEMKREDRSDQHRVEFTLKDCPMPYLALQASTLEDLQAVLDHATRLPVGFVSRVFYLGKELGFDDRLGLKWTAVSQFVEFRLGLSSQMPSGNIYVLLAAPGCSSFGVIDWQHIWVM